MEVAFFIRIILIACAIIKMVLISTRPNYQLAKAVEERRYRIRRANLKNGIRHPLEDFCNWLTPPRYRFVAFIVNLLVIGFALVGHWLGAVVLIAVYVWHWIRGIGKR